MGWIIIIIGAALVASTFTRQKIPLGRGRKIANFVVGIPAILVGLFLTAPTEATQAEGNARLEQTSIDARLATRCQKIVASQLTSPGSAKFVTVDSTQFKSIAGVRTYAAYVDSQNALGAILRTHFRCSIDGDNVTLDYIK